MQPNAITLERTTALTLSVRDFVAASHHREQDFDALALAVVVNQAEALPGYSRLFQHRGQRAARIQRWQDAPPIPTAAFKQQALTLLPVQRVFRSSGTTEGKTRRSEHHHGNLDLYRLIVGRTFPQAVLGKRSLTAGSVSILSLISPTTLVPDSSLGFMTDWVFRSCGNEHSSYSFTEAKLDLDIALGWISTMEAHDDGVSEGVPLVLTTGLALWSLLDAIELTNSRPKWPANTIVMETGGFKTRRLDLNREQMVERFEQLTGLDRNRIVREYGMTELSSQAYSSTLHSSTLHSATHPFSSSDWFSIPPWMRVRALDPLTMKEVPPPISETSEGESAVGLLAFLDLGNVASAASIVTEDLGLVSADHRSFQLLGRAPDAELRGCSLATEALLK